jgi:hypothetical protein
MFVFLEDAAEAVTSVDGQVGEPFGVGDRQSCRAIVTMPTGLLRW